MITKIEFSSRMKKKNTNNNYQKSKSQLTKSRKFRTCCAHKTQCNSANNAEIRIRSIQRCYFWLYHLHSIKMISTDFFSLMYMLIKVFTYKNSTPFLLKCSIWVKMLVNGTNNTNQMFFLLAFVLSNSFIN